MCEEGYERYDYGDAVRVVRATTNTPRRRRSWGERMVK